MVASTARSAVLGTAVLWLCVVGGGCVRDDLPRPVDGGDGGRTSDGSAGDVGGGGGPDVSASLYQRLNGETGIRTVVTDFVDRVLKDPKVNGYFLNTPVSGMRVIDCLVLQVSALTGGGVEYPGTSVCRDMKATHAGMKISRQDFDDVASHLVAALEAAGVPAADMNAIAAAVTPLAADIVEDPTSNGTVYQRVGRKAAIATVVDLFLAKVQADTRINGFFSATDAARLKTCLVRQVCNIDGPCRYGQEVLHASEPGVGPTIPCKDMRATHTGLATPRPIGKVDFDAMVEDLVMVLDGAGVAAADREAILGALSPQCDDIVSGGLGCAGRKVIALTGTGTLITFDSKRPGTVSTGVTPSGLQAGESLHGITLRPANGKLYGLGSSSRLYVINPINGMATAVGSGPFTPTLAGTTFGVDFNPAVDRIRVVSDAGQNLRLHPDTGAVAGADPAINPAGAAISAVAYTNSSGSAPRVTTLYDIDVSANKLMRQGGVDGTPSPNQGTLTEVGDLGVNPVGAAGFDIVYLGGTNHAYAVMMVGSTTSLFRVSLATGAATAVAELGEPMTTALTVKGIAISP